MATENHNVESQAGEPQAPLPAGSGQSRGGHADADLDLFDFPVVEDPFAQTDDDTLAERTPASTMTHAAAPADEPALSELMSVGEPDFDLDEDLFHFAELFTATESEAGDDAIRAFSEPEPEAAGAPESELELEIPVASSAEAESVAPVSIPASAPAPAPEHTLERFSGSDLDLGPLLIGAVQHTDTDFSSERSSIIRDNLIEVLVILFLSVNGALIVFAWQANTSFRSTLDGVRTDIADSLRDVGTSELLAAAPAHIEPDPIAVEEAPTPLASYAELELGLAREAMRSGEYATARRRLYRLLANQDRFPVSAELLATSEYLIADSYFEEGRALGGSSR